MLLPAKTAQSVLPSKTADELTNVPILEEIEEARDAETAPRTKIRPLYAGLTTQASIAASWGRLARRNRTNARTRWIGRSSGW
jgi:hypothetical protein